MPKIQLKYGRGSMPLEYDDGRFEILGGTDDPPPLSDIQLNAKLDSPLGSPTLEEIIQPGETVLFVVPDATRRAACGQIINLIVRRLIANGTTPHEMSIIFATGIHRAVTEAEKHEILTPFIAQRIKTIDHHPRDLVRLIRMGETSGGITVELDRALTEFDHVILIGGVTFHYFAGFTGGRKLICPGLASSRTISATHKLAFDCDLQTRREGVGTGLLDGNHVHEAFVEAASFIKPSFAVNTIVDENGDAIDVFCGDWIESHRAACNAYAERNTIEITHKREIVVASCGGHPHDVNMIQAHKALEAASQACVDGGTIVLLAECDEGTGRTDFIRWFDADNSGELAGMLCEAYQVNGQTAWSLLRKTERFDVRIVTAMPDELTAKMRMKKILTLDGLGGGEGYLLPNGATNSIKLV
jgi:nickel-dependent lactate racemase